MYSILLHSHNGMRLLILLSVFALIAYLITGIVRKSEWTKAGRILTVVYTGLMDLQVLIGLLLYFVYSPIPKAAFQDFGAAMKNTELRFYAVEHITFMVLAVVFAHIAGKVGKRSYSHQKKYNKTLLFIGLSVLCVLIAIPWNRPWM